MAQPAAPRSSMTTISAALRYPGIRAQLTSGLEVAKVERESEIITSFYLRRVDGAPLYRWEPGQFLPIRLDIPGHSAPVLRTYTLSTCDNPHFYRLSIRRIEDGLVSRFMHDNAKAGFSSRR